MTEKSILEQALLQVQTLEEAVKQNAKGILASTMKEELNELLKESEEEGQKDEEVSEGDVPPVKDEAMSEDSKEGEKDMSEQPEDEEAGDEEEEAGDEEEGGEENVDDLDNEDPMKDIDSMDSEGDEPEDEMGMDDMSSDEMGMDDMPSDDDVMDMTGASDEEVLKIFKAMKPEDGIVVKKDGEDIELDMDGDEYIIKLDGEGSEEDEEFNEEPIYEIELDEEDEVEVEASEGEQEPKEVEATEAARTYANDVRKPANQGKKYKAGRREINEEVETLKKQNAEYKKALVLFKEKLNEVAVFNANLAYATRLFTEHSTTKQEKLNILKRFDSVSTMNESKTLFNTIKSELGVKKPVTESVVDKISATPQSSSSKEVLSESKAYENPQFKRMKDLMSKIK
jgi:hypothetical protein